MHQLLTTNVQGLTCQQPRASAHPGLLHGIPTDRDLWKCQACSDRSRLDLFLERSDCKGFHNSPCWLCLHLHLLAERHPHAGFCGWLDPGLDAAKAWDGEHTSLLHLLCGNGREAVKDLGDLFAFKPCSVAMSFTMAPFV